MSLQWLEKVFVPQIQEKHGIGAPVILQLDGHNSHTTYQFALVCARHHIELVISPSHTTHRLQPCDVAVFSPLATAYKRVISQAATIGTRLSKRTLPLLYGKARTDAFKPETIKTAFRKAGVWPLDRLAIEDEAYEPSKNTSTQPSMPIPVLQSELLIEVSPDVASLNLQVVSSADSAELPNMELLASIPGPSLLDGSITNNIASAFDPSTSTAVSLPSTAQFRLAGLVPPSRRNSTKESLIKENQLLRSLLEQAKKQIEADHALKVLMEDENGRIRQELHGKKKVDRKRAPGEGQARLMTSCEQLDALAEYDWKHNMEAVLHCKDAKQIFKERRAMIKSDEDTQADELRREKRSEEIRLKASEKREKQIDLALERARKADLKRQERDLTRARKELEKLAEKSRKAEARKKVTKIKGAAKAKKPKAMVVKPSSSAELDTPDGLESDRDPEGFVLESEHRHATNEVQIGDSGALMDQIPVMPLNDKTMTQKSKDNQFVIADSASLKVPARTTRSTTRRQALASK